MKNHYLISSLTLAFVLSSACSSKKIIENLSEDRAPASDAARYKVANVDLQVQKNTIVYCGKKFDTVDVVSSHPGVIVYSKLVALKNLPFAYPVPAAINIASPETAGVFSNTRSAKVDLVGQGVIVKNPIFPSIPIVSTDKEKEVCPDLVKYHSKFTTALKTGKVKVSKILNLRSGVVSLNLAELKTQIVKEAKKVKATNDALAKVQVPPPGVERPPVDFLIFYDDPYMNDVAKLTEVHRSLGYHPVMISLTQLPGYRQTDPIPAECEGDFKSECFHVNGTQVSGLSQGAVPTTKGMVNEVTMSQSFTRSAYIPGLIRAQIRRYKKQNTLKGVLLVGNPDRIPGYYSTMDGYGFFPYAFDQPEEQLFPHLHTDLYYMIPEVALSPTGTFSHERVTPDIWMCQKGGDISTRHFAYWCNNDEGRAWPEPPLSVLKWGGLTPNSRIMALKNSEWSAVYLSPEDMAKTTLKDVIPVGRIVTHENLSGVHDEVVNNYSEKMVRWNRELPSMTGNSIQSDGGSTSDTWIFLDADLTQFRATYGSNSSIYASEFFLPLSKCQGWCQYKDGNQIMQELSGKNRVAFHINGHGGHIAVQAPYANGNVASLYYSDNVLATNQYNQLIKIQYPQDNTIKPLENAGLVGHVIANSCDLSNFNLDNSWHKMMLERDPSVNVSSFAELWLGVKNGGAMNVYLNSDVGWGYSDNNYNVKFMSKVAQAHQQCGTIGDALKLTVYDMLQGFVDGAGEWQAINRQFMGSPVNKIARPHIRCSMVNQGGDLEVGRE